MLLSGECFFAIQNALDPSYSRRELLDLRDEIDPLIEFADNLRSMGDLGPWIDEVLQIPGVDLYDPAAIEAMIREWPDPMLTVGHPQAPVAEAFMVLNPSYATVDSFHWPISLAGAFIDNHLFRMFVRFNPCAIEPFAEEVFRGDALRGQALTSSVQSACFLATEIYVRKFNFDASSAFSVLRKRISSSIRNQGKLRQEIKGLLNNFSVSSPGSLATTLHEFAFASHGRNSMGLPNEQMILSYRDEIRFVREFLEELGLALPYDPLESLL